MQKFLIQLPRNLKRLFLMSVDVVSIYISVWAALMLRSGDFFWLSDGYELTKATPDQLYNAIILAIVITIPMLTLSRLYRSITRYISLETYVKITKATFAASITWGILLYVNHSPIPRSSIALFFIILTSIIFLTRFTARSYLLQINDYMRKRVLIYGVNDYARQLATILSNDLEIKPIGFISDKKFHKNSSIGERPIYSSKELPVIIANKNVEEIIVMPDKTSKQLRRMLNEVSHQQITIRKLPDINALTKGNIKITDIQRVEIEDLLGRDAIKPDSYLLKSCIENKTVMITGCGGSIGSELSRQIIGLNPDKIVLIEQSEYFLYEIDQELNEINNNSQSRTIIKSFLGSVSDHEFMAAIFTKHKIDTIYHAAANKHVPLVEYNPIAAIKTNILGTHIVAQLAQQNNVANFVLISSDKAVRPTNIMGATKRFAELILQALQDKGSDQKPNNTKFCMVRFGNVLDTSGSVVPLFRKQIAKGGPVTVTDKRVIRYFMTIKEATELVIQAGSMSKGGDVFLLEMGEPVYVLDLAKEMIRLSGYEVKNEDNPYGDIEIIFTGLRAGEKLYEELLIGDDVSQTTHKHIMSANEEKLSHDKIIDLIDQFSGLTAKSNLNEIHNILFQSVKGYEPSKNNVVDISSK